MTNSLLLQWQNICSGGGMAMLKNMTDVQIEHFSGLHEPSGLHWNIWIDIHHLEISSALNE
jgi:hypothetical protein